MSNNNIFYNKRWFWGTVFIIVIFVIPLIINETYKHGGYITVWAAADMLSFYGSLLAFAGTVVLGAIAVWQTKRANVLSEQANEQTTRANDLSDKLVQLEANRYKLELRPFVMATDYIAYMKNQFEILTNPDKLYIQVSRVEENEPKVLCIAFSLTNTTYSYISVYYSKAKVDDGTEWTNSTSNQKDPNLRLKAGETGEVIFYAPSKFFKAMLSKRIKFILILENRFGESYREEFNVLITSLSPDIIGYSKENNWFISMRTNKYAVSKLEKDSNDKAVEMQEEM